MSVTRDWRISFRTKDKTANHHVAECAAELLDDLTHGDVDGFLYLGDQPRPEWSGTFTTTSVYAFDQIFDAIEECSRRFPELLFHAVVFDCATHEAEAANFSDGEREYLKSHLIFSMPKRIIYNS